MIEITVYLHSVSSGDTRAIRDELTQLSKLGASIMNAITDFAAQQSAHNDRVSEALNGLADDIQTLNDLIAKIQNSPGSLSTADQAALDALTTTGEALAKKAEALNDLTPPAIPAA